MPYENVQLESSDGIAVVTIAREKALNALNVATLRDLRACLDEVRGDESLRALILTGAGERAFVAGADIAEMREMTVSEARAFAARGHATFAALEALPVPTLAAVNGFALGGGCELAVACDLVYASDRAKFGQPEVNLGVTPGFGGTQRLTRLLGKMRAKELIFTGDIVDAARAREIGLVLEVIPHAQLMEHCRTVARKIAGKGPLAVAQAKRVIESGADADLHVANELETQAFGALFGTRDQKEGMAAFLEKRTAKFEGA